MNSPATRPRQSANSPINTVTKDDIEAGKEKLDQWLRKLTNDTVISNTGSCSSSLSALATCRELVITTRPGGQCWRSRGACFRVERCAQANP